MYRTTSRIGMVLVFLAVMTLPASFESQASADGAGAIVAGILGGALAYELLKPSPPPAYYATPVYAAPVYSPPVYYPAPPVYYGTYGSPYYTPPVVVAPPRTQSYGGFGGDWDDHPFWPGVSRNDYGRNRAPAPYVAPRVAPAPYYGGYGGR